MRRKKKRKLKRWCKIIAIVLPLIALVMGGLIFGFKIKTISYSSDLNQYSEEEVYQYINHKKIESTLVFWVRDKIGLRPELEMFDDYSVKMQSPFEVKIIASEKKLKGGIKADNLYYYFDEDAMVLKESLKPMKNVPQVEGLAYKKLELYQIIIPKKEKALESILTVSKSIEEYKYDVSKIVINEQLELTLHIKKIQLQLGKIAGLDKKLRDFNDLYDNVIKREGVLNMKHISADGKYTMKKITKSQKKGTKKKK